MAGPTAGRVPAIHVVPSTQSVMLWTPTWMPATSAGMTDRLCLAFAFSAAKLDQLYPVLSRRRRREHALAVQPVAERGRVAHQRCQGRVEFDEIVLHAFLGERGIRA